MKTIVRMRPMALTIAIILSAASGAFIHPFWTTSAQTMAKVGGGGDIHEAAWSDVIERAKVDPYYICAIYASRSLAVKHPEVYLKGDKLFFDIATKEGGYARAYSIKDVHHEYLYGKSRYPFNLTKNQLEKILKGMGINPVSVVYAYSNQTVTVPPAVVKPIIDGKYTPLDQLKYTEIGDKLPWKDKVKHEWDDSVQEKYVMFYQLNPEKQEPEWYIKLKHDEKYLYVLIEGVSDHEIGKVYKKDNIRKDGRQWFDFLFDTKNVGKSDPGTPGVYWLGLKFVSGEQLGPMDLYGAKPPGNLLPKEYYKCSASLSESPISSIPHIIIESAFD